MPNDNLPTPNLSDGTSLPGDATSNARMAHELANLLDASLRNLNLALADLKQGPASPGPRPHDDELTRRLEIASHGLKQMAHLLHLWLAPKSAAAALANARTLQATVDQAVNLMRPLLQANHITLKVRVARDIVQLPVGPIEPVLINALRNSIEAVAGAPSPGLDGRIEIEVEPDGAGHTCLFVRDNGPGLDPNLLGPDGHAHFGHSTKPGGHGLGLTICQEIARSLHGSLILQNLTPRGAELMLRWPNHQT